MANQQSTLENVTQYSFPANNLFQISLVRDTDPNRPGYKKQYFCFLTLAPGEQGQQGGRTFNFSNKINMKQDIHKVLALAYAIRACARGQQQMIGKWSLFTDSSKSGFGQGGGVKMVFVNQYTNSKDQNNPRNQVSLGFKAGQNQPVGLVFDIPDALALADIIESIGKRGLQLEMRGGSVSFGQQPQQQGSRSSTPSPGPFSDNPQQGSGGNGSQQPQQQNPRQQNNQSPQGDPGFGEPPPARGPGDVANNFQNAMGGFNQEDDIPF